MTFVVEPSFHLVERGMIMAGSTGSDFGRYLRRMRNERDLTQKELEKAWGKSQTTVSDIENGKRELDKSDAPALAHALGRPLDEVLQAAGFLPNDELPEIIRVRDEDEAQVIHSYRGISSPDDKAFVRQMLEKMRKMDRESSIGGQNADDLPDTSERQDRRQNKNR